MPLTQQALPKKGIRYEDIDFSASTEARVGKSANGVCRATLYSDANGNIVNRENAPVGTTAKVVYFKPAGYHLSYTPLLAKYSVAMSYIYSIVLGRDFVPEERLVFDNEGNITGTICFAVRYRRMLYEQENISDIPEEDRPFVDPTPEMLIFMRVAWQIVSAWLYGDDDRHAANISLDAFIDHDRNLCDWINIVKIVKNPIKKISEIVAQKVGKAVNVIRQMLAPEKRIPISAEDLENLAEVDRMHWYGNQYSGNGNPNKNPRSWASFSALKDMPEFHEQTMEAIIFHLVFHDLDSIRANLKEYFGDIPLHYRECFMEEGRPKEHISMLERNPQLFNEYTNQGSFVEHMIDMKNLRYDRLYRIMMEYEGCKYRNGDPKLPKFDIYMRMKPGVLQRLLAWAEKHNNTLAEDDPKRYNLEHVKERYLRLWRDSNLKYTMTMLDDLQKLIDRLANDLCRENIPEVSLKPTDTENITKASHYFTPLRDKQPRALDCDPNSASRQGYLQLVEIKKEMTRLIDQYYGVDYSYVIYDKRLENLEKDKIYIRKLNGKIAYSMITVKGEKVLDQIIEDLPFNDEELKSCHITRLERFILPAAVKNGHACAEIFLTEEHNEHFVAGLEALYNRYNEQITKLFISETTSSTFFTKIMGFAKTFASYFDFKRFKNNADVPFTPTNMADNMTASVTSAKVRKHTDEVVINRCLDKMFEWANEQHKIKLLEEAGDPNCSALTVCISNTVHFYLTANSTFFDNRGRGETILGYTKDSTFTKGEDYLLNIWGDSTGGTEDTSFNTHLLRKVLPLMLESKQADKEFNFFFQDLINAVNDNKIDYIAYTKKIVSLCQQRYQHNLNLFRATCSAMAPNAPKVPASSSLNNLASAKVQTNTATNPALFFSAPSIESKTPLKSGHTTNRTQSSPILKPVSAATTTRTSAPVHKKPTPPAEFKTPTANPTEEKKVTPSAFIDLMASLGIKKINKIVEQAAYSTSSWGVSLFSDTSTPSARTAKQIIQSCTTDDACRHSLLMILGYKHTRDDLFIDKFIIKMFDSISERIKEKKAYKIQLSPAEVVLDADKKIDLPPTEIAALKNYAAQNTPNVNKALASALS